MKKGMKIALWGAGICMAAGLILIGVGIAAGGAKDMVQVEDLHAEVPEIIFPSIGIEVYHGEKELAAYPVYSGAFDTEIPCEDSLLRLDVEVGVHSLSIEEGAEDKIFLEGENCDRIQCYVKDNTLYLRDVGKYKKYLKTRDRHLVLTLPADIVWEKANLEADMGNLEMDSLQAEEAELSADMGNVDLESCRVNQLEAEANMGNILVMEAEVSNADFEASMGNVDITGRISGNVSASADMGSIFLYLNQQESDFDYDLAASMGSVLINGTEYAGLDRERTISNNARQKMELDSSMGSIEISFE